LAVWYTFGFCHTSKLPHLFIHMTHLLQSEIFPTSAIFYGFQFLSYIFVAAMSNLDLIKYLFKTEKTKIHSADGTSIVRDGLWLWYILGPNTVSNILLRPLFSTSMLLQIQKVGMRKDLCDRSYNTIIHTNALLCINVKFSEHDDRLTHVERNMSSYMECG
jgi:hypothetical protein